MDETRVMGTGHILASMKTHTNSHATLVLFQPEHSLKPDLFFLQAIFLLHANRVGHGYHVVQSAELYNYVIDKQIHLEVCEIQP